MGLVLIRHRLNRAIRGYLAKQQGERRAAILFQPFETGNAATSVITVREGGGQRGRVSIQVALCAQSRTTQQMNWPRRLVVV